jgi:Sec-independent protein translocase protein TatA
VPRVRSASRAGYHAATVGPELLILIIVLVVVVFWRGPATLPKLGEALGKAIRSVRESLPSGDQDDAADDPAPSSASDDRSASDDQASGPRAGA